MTSIRILVGSVYGGALLTARTLKKELEGEG
ncbi:MAG: flavodoxin, partial [Marinobacter sp.]|nr:flavodoxin [Marinobacter sp.]